MARKVKYQSFNSTIADICLGELEDLASEMRDWFDNMPEALQGGSKGDAVNEAADALENLELPDVPDFLEEVPFSYNEGHKGGRSGDPRWLRRDNAVSMLAGAKDAAEAWCDEQEQALEEAGEVSEGAKALAAKMAEEAGTEVIDVDAQVQEARDFIDALETLISDAESVEFPGMMG